MAKKLRWFTIKPKQWACGQNVTGSTKLYDKKGNKKKCCLGFMGQQLGIPLTKLAGIGLPSELDEDLLQRYRDIGFTKADESFCEAVNDDYSLDDKAYSERVKQINRGLIEHEAPFRFKLVP